MYGSFGDSGRIWSSLLFRLSDLFERFESFSFNVVFVCLKVGEIANV